MGTNAGVECKASFNIDFPGDIKPVTENREFREMLRIINTRTTNTGELGARRTRRDRDNRYKR